MMLDAKRTFDDLIARLAPDVETRDEILANPIYRHISGAVAGSPEYTAIAKLFEFELEFEFEFEHESEFDVIGARQLAGEVARTHADVQLLARRDAAAVERLRGALHDADPISLTDRDRDRDLRDIGGLVDLDSELFGRGHRG